MAEAAVDWMASAGVDGTTLECEFAPRARGPDLEHVDTEECSVAGVRGRMFLTAGV